MVQVIPTIQTVIETEISPAASIPLHPHTGILSGKILPKTIYDSGNTKVTGDE